MRITLLVIAFSVLFIACSEKSDPLFDQQQFIKIYETGEFNAGYYPVDIKEIPEGYFILAERKYPEQTSRGVYLIKLDKTGKIVDELMLDENSANPVAPLFINDNQASFFAMSLFDSGTEFITVDFSTSPMTVTNSTIPGIYYPGAAAATDQGLILLSYDHINQETVVTTHDASGNLEDQIRVSIGAGEGVEGPIVAHYLRTGQRYPFQVGQAGPNLYFFNAFINYTFSLAFTDMTTIHGIVNGQQDDAGISAVQQISTDDFAVSRFSFGENYLIPKATLLTNQLSSADDLGGFIFPELTENAPVRIIRTQTESKSMVVYASNTKSDQIGLFFFDESIGEFLSSRYVGFSNPFEIGCLIKTQDGGLAVAGTTYTAGRFARISLIKISSADIETQAH